MARHGRKDGEITRAMVEDAALRFERNYNAVAIVRESERAYNVRGTEGYTIKAIAARDADLDEVSRGMQSLLHWLLHD